jgi:hypothetical protein
MGGSTWASLAQPGKIQEIEASILPDLLNHFVALGRHLTGQARRTWRRRQAIELSS